MEWARRRGINAELISHLAVEEVQQGDVVLGTLPVNMVADICARGASYFHLIIDLPPELRGKELSADEMARAGACLRQYYVTDMETHTGEGKT